MLDEKYRPQNTALGYRSSRMYVIKPEGQYECSAEYYKIILYIPDKLHFPIPFIYGSIHEPGLKVKPGFIKQL